uniref:Thymus, brain and testes associated n=1 Tax=Gouania willdenowi TaxID=441366 RepID=A0A8C5I0U4_GOUWI
AGIRHQNKQAKKSSCATELKWECKWRQQDIRHTQQFMKQLESVLKYIVNNINFTTMMSKSCPRFGSLSHHSFFSRHNPHPNRVRHIQGLNGRPICSVRDDWFVTSSLFPHPLLKSHETNLVRDELKELAAKVSLTSQEKKAKKAPWVRSKTQSSPGTGRIIPPHTKSSWRRSNQQRKHPLLFQDQELMVFELLCQILQTDSLSSVQQWLLLAGQRVKVTTSSYFHPPPFILGNKSCHGSLGYSKHLV